MYRIIDVIKYFVVFSLMVLVAFLLYLAMLQLRGEEITLFGRKPYTLNAFLSHLREGAPSLIREHHLLYKGVKTLNPILLGDEQHAKNLPYDYTYFVQRMVPGFFDVSPHDVYTAAAAKHVLQTFARDSGYTATLLLLTGGESRILRGKRIRKGFPKRFEITGTYTSPFHYPTGLFMINGEVLNPALQDWDGLVIIDGDGTVHVKSIHALEYQFRRFHITESHRDYLDFLALAEHEKWSLFQTHLVVNDGEVDVSPDSQRRFRRRAIFQNRQQTVFIYDSVDERPTLYELAQTLQEEYGAQYAVNLDMGPFGYCARYEDGQRVELYGAKAPNVHLSNVLVFHYR